jgi:hypothetical protein
VDPTKLLIASLHSPYNGGNVIVWLQELKYHQCNGAVLIFLDALLVPTNMLMAFHEGHSILGKCFAYCMLQLWVFLPRHSQQHLW